MQKSCCLLNSSKARFFSALNFNRNLKNAFYVESPPKFFSKYNVTKLSAIEEKRPVDYEWNLWQLINKENFAESTLNLSRWYGTFNNQNCTIPLHLETFDLLINSVTGNTRRGPEIIKSILQHLETFGYISEMRNKVIKSLADGPPVAEQERLARIYAKAIKKLATPSKRLRIVADLQRNSLEAFPDVLRLIGTLNSRFVDFSIPSSSLQKSQQNLLASLFLVYGYSNKIDDMLKALYMLLDSNIETLPNIVSLAIDCCGFSNRIEQADALWKDLKEKYKYELDMNNYTSFIECLARNGYLEKAIVDVVQHDLWETRKILPDFKTIKTITSFGGARRSENIGEDPLLKFLEWLKDKDLTLYKQVQSVYDQNKQNDSSIKY